MKIRTLQFSSSSFLFLSVIFLSWAFLISTQSQSPSLACKSTPYPKLCRTILKAVKSSPSDPYHYGKFTIKQCLKQASRLSKVITGYLRRLKNKPGSVTAAELAAVADCGELSELSVNYLETVMTDLKTAQMMTAALVEHVNSLLSGVVTNQQTCLDGLADAKTGFAAAIGSPMGNLTRLYGISLGLVSHALNHNLKRFKPSKGKVLGGGSSTYREPLETLIKDGKGKGKVAEADVTILSDDELLMEQLGTKPYAVRQPGTGPSGMRQPLFDETPQKSKKAKTTGGLDLDELMELDAEKEDEEMAELAGLDKLVNKVVSETGGNDGRRDEDTSMVGALGIVCGLQAADTPKAPAEAQETPLPLAERQPERQPDVVHEDPVVPEEEAKAVDAEQVGGVSEATDFNLKELGFAAVEEWKTNIFYKKIDAFVPMQYIVNDLAVPKTIFREIATKGEHVSTNHMELMLALVWNKLRTSLSEKRAVVLDTNFMQHLLKDEDKLKQKRSKPFKWHRSLVAIVNGEYAPRAGNTGWIVDVDVVYAPMNWSGNHWVALCIDLVGGIVTVFDCFHGLHSEEKAVEIMAPVLESLPQLIADNADPLEGDYEAPTSFVFKRPKNVSQNIPTGDCGPMSVKFIELHAQGKPLDCMTEEMVDNLRVNYAVDIYETFYTPLS